MWDLIWSALAVERDVVRLDLRGFGESTTRPRGMLSPADDVLDTLAELGIDRSHLVGASFGAAVAVEAALTRPRQVASLLLSPPGGSLIAKLVQGEVQRSALYAQAARKIGRAGPARPKLWRSPLTALGERDALVRDAERRAGQALRTLTHDEGLSLREAVDWCGSGITM